jgi:Complex 1 protein (LYR family)
MSSINLYRQLLKAANAFPVRPVGRKIAYNCRELFDWYRPETRPEELRRLHEDAEAALRVIDWMRALPKVVWITSLHTTAQLARRPAMLAARMHCTRCWQVTRKSRPCLAPGVVVWSQICVGSPALIKHQSNVQERRICGTCFCRRASRSCLSTSCPRRGHSGSEGWPRRRHGCGPAYWLRSGENL